jgi:hypothetical protein
MQNRYEGEWVQGKRCGYGIFQYASGARYEGEWKDNNKVSSFFFLIASKLTSFNVQHGIGYYLSENGRKYFGEFRNDRALAEWPKFQNGETRNTVVSIPY